MVVIILFTSCNWSALYIHLKVYWFYFLLVLVDITVQTSGYWYVAFGSAASSSLGSTVSSCLYLFWVFPISLHLNHPEICIRLTICILIDLWVLYYNLWFQFLCSITGINQYIAIINLFNVVDGCRKKWRILSLCWSTMKFLGRYSQTKMKDFSFITHTHLVKDLVWGKAMLSGIVSTLSWPFED